MAAPAAARCSVATLPGGVVRTERWFTGVRTHSLHIPSGFCDDAPQALVAVEDVPGKFADSP